MVWHNDLNLCRMTDTIVLIINGYCHGNSIEVTYHNSPKVSFQKHRTIMQCYLCQLVVIKISPLEFIASKQLMKILLSCQQIFESLEIVSIIPHIMYPLNCSALHHQFLRLKTLVPQTGFEPATYRLEGGCSIQLSYWGILILFN